MTFEDDVRLWSVLESFHSRLLKKAAENKRVNGSIGLEFFEGIDSETGDLVFVVKDLARSSRCKEKKDGV